MSFEGDLCKKMTPLNKQTALENTGKKEKKEALALELLLHPGPVRDANDAP